MEIPRSLPSSLGKIRVKMVDDLKDNDGDDLAGMYIVAQRLILLRRGMHPKAELATLFHEWLHVVLCDAGVQFTKKQEETVCDSVGTALAAFINQLKP